MIGRGETKNDADHALTGGVSGSLFLLANILCWASVPVLLRYLTGTLDAWTANGFRYPLAAVLYWPILLVALRRGHLTRRTVGCCLVPAVLAFGGQVFWALAPYYLPASAIGFFMRFSLVFALVGAMLFFADERRLLSLPLFYVGLALALGGFVGMAFCKIRFDAEVTGAGIVIILLCGVFFGFYGVSVRYFLRGIHPLVGFGVVAHFVSAGALAAMFAVGDYGALRTVVPRDWLVLVVSSMLGIALGHYFLYSAVSRLGAAVTSSAQTIVPFLTMFIAARVLGESLTGPEWCAGLTMVSGAAVLLRTQQQLVPDAERLTGDQDVSGALPTDRIEPTTERELGDAVDSNRS